MSPYAYLPMLTHSLSMSPYAYLPILHRLAIALCCGGVHVRLADRAARREVRARLSAFGGQVSFFKCTADIRCESCSQVDSPRYHLI